MHAISNSPHCCCNAAHCAGCQGLLAKTTAANKLCKPGQDQSTHTGTHGSNICLTHTYRCTCVYLSVIFCHFYLHKQQSCRAKLLHSLAAFIVRPAERRLGQRNMQMPHKCSSSNSPNASAVPRPLCNVALSAALRHFTSHFACARV